MASNHLLFFMGKNACSLFSLTVLHPIKRGGRGAIAVEQVDFRRDPGHATINRFISVHVSYLDVFCQG